MATLKLLGYVLETFGLVYWPLLILLAVLGLQTLP